MVSEQIKPSSPIPSHTQRTTQTSFPGPSHRFYARASSNTVPSAYHILACRLNPDRAMWP